ncbi:MAG: right-handed parallel beta-helix repeat-containing protein [Planctomycetota bacterium]|nr:MAG: right-handed parallel beta-helix repeat-containing protein [Planctomycetota bacterium]
MCYRITAVFLVIIMIGSQTTPVAAGDPVRTCNLPAFPGAEGFGADTPGGRGGRVIRVTTLADSGPGSLREAIGVREPRTIIFEVGGTIQLESDLNIWSPFLTVAGQTAPSPGVTITGNCLRVETHDVVIQHLRFRGGANNSFAIPGSSDGSREVYNVIVSHCSISWATNKNLNIWYPSVHDVTIRNCIVSESLPYPMSGNRMGFLIGDHAKRIAVIGNLFAHNSRRNPAPFGDTSTLIVNNVVYNPGSGPIHFQDGNGSGSLIASVVGNVVIPGQDTPAQWCKPDQCPPIHILNSTAQGTRIYLADNEAPGRTEDPWSVALVETSFDVKANSPPVWVAPLTVRDSSGVLGWVLTNAGARPWNRDAADARVISDVLNGTGRLINSPEDVGGSPDLEPSRRALNLPAYPNGDDDRDGYTNLEEWLFGFEHDNSFVVFLPLVLR